MFDSGSVRGSPVSPSGRWLPALLVAGIALVAGVAALLVPLAAIAAAQSVTPASDAPDSFCPKCRRGVTWELEKCPACGLEFEPLVPRTARAPGSTRPAYGPEGGTATAGREESPFAAPPPGAPADKQEPQRSLIDSPWRQIQPPDRSRFGLGSYGRIGINTQTDLNAVQPLDIVDYVPIFAKSPYEELHFFYKDELNGLPVLIKSTLAFDQKIFHYDGDFDVRLALREVYCELSPTPDVAVWAGARMYRGDNIYLFDFWPLDDQNTVGAGGAMRLDGVHRIQAHVGYNRITDEDTFYYFQPIELPRTDEPGSREAVFLDRNRGTASLTYTLDLPVGFKAKVHGEATYVPPGVRRLALTGAEQRLPSDHGFLIGGQLGWHEDTGALKGSFANVFVRYASGLAAYDEVSVPFGFDTDLQVTDAERIILGLAANLETEYAGVLAGAFWQSFEDADSVDTANDSQQYGVAVRPLAYLGDYVRAGFELAWQGKENRRIFPETGSEEFQHLTRLSLLVGLAPSRGTLARPEITAFFTWKWLNTAAAQELGRTRLAEKPDLDEQSFGVYAEWWF